MARKKKTRSTASTPRRSPKAKARKDASASASDTPGRGRLGLPRRGWMTLAGLLLLGSAALGAAVGIPMLGELAAQRIAQQSRQVQLWLTRPAWMPQRHFDAVMDQAQAAYAAVSRRLGPAEALSVEPLRAVQESLATSGWAARPPRVVRRPPSQAPVSADSHADSQDNAPSAVEPPDSTGSASIPRRWDVHIEMAWRRPAAVVRSSAFQRGDRPGLRDTAIDASAHVLPMAGPPESFPGLRVILNPARLPAPAPSPADGAWIWPGQDVRDALSLLALLEQQPFAPQVAGIDLAEYARDGRLLIVSTTGGRVVWGAAPGGEGLYRGEVSDEKKLANILGLVQATGQIDGGQERVEIHWPGTVLLGETPSTTPAQDRQDTNPTGQP